MAAPTPREIALRILRRWERGEAYVDTLLYRELPTITGRDRLLCQELVYGIVRRRGTLDWLIEQFTSGRRQPALVQMILRIGIYQIFWLDRVPGHAAVNETVALARKCDIGTASGFVNAVLRNSLRKESALRKQLEELKQSNPSIAHSHPDWLLRRWQAQWGEAEATQLLEWNNCKPQNFARINSLRNPPDTAYKSTSFNWATENFLRFDGAAELLPGFSEGNFYIQDPSTLLAVELLNPKPGETVLDFCASPGGKTTAIAARMKNGGRIVATDIHEDRLTRLRENCKRLGADCVEVMPHGTYVRERFDSVLIDVPCSNTGVMRRRVDLRWRLQPHDLKSAVKTQRDILLKAALNVKPGGLLVYSTCSLEAEENTEQVENFLSTRNDFKLETERALLPFRDEVDGAYVAALRSTPL